MYVWTYCTFLNPKQQNIKPVSQCIAIMCPIALSDSRFSAATASVAIRYPCTNFLKSSANAEVARVL
jgi:hypothetical protein